jgi:DNA ligase (NAD+)
MSSPSQIAHQSSELKARLPTLTLAELEQLVRHHNARYWDVHDPEIDDPTFDALVEVLRDKAPSSAALQELGAAPKKAGKAGFGDIVHSRPMLSLEKCYDDDTLLKWAGSFKGPIMVTPKIDGLACSLRYDERGRLVIAGTRGDGRRAWSVASRCAAKFTCASRASTPTTATNPIRATSPLAR